MTAPFEFNTTPSIVFGNGSVANIGPLAAARLGRRVLVVTDPGLERAGIVARVAAALADSGLDVTVFADTVADPTEAVVLAAAEAAVSGAAEGIVGVGGGSSLDVAKLAALLAVGRERLGEIYGIRKARGPRLPLMLVPTTSGTGSEVTPIAIVTTVSGEKMGVVSPVILPDVALLDPELTIGLPRQVTAATGVDAMVHAIEAFTSRSPNANPLSRALAREALGLLGGNLEQAVQRGGDREARAAMMLGAMLAGQAFANAPVAAVHALAYPLGGQFHLPHGAANALMLPHVLRFNAPAAAAAYAELAPLAFPALANADAAARPAAFADALADLCGRCGLPPRLRDVGIPEEAIPALAADAMKQTRLLVNNPRPLEPGDAVALYRAAW